MTSSSQDMDDEETPPLCECCCCKEDEEDCEGATCEEGCEEQSCCETEGSCPLPSSDNPVRYRTGAVQVQSKDLWGMVFGHRWGFNLGYASIWKGITLSAAGNNWLPTPWGAQVHGYIHPAGGGNYDARWDVYLDGKTKLTFNLQVGFQYKLLGPGNYQLSGPTPFQPWLDFLLYSPEGRRMKFYGMGPNPVLRGKLKEIVNKNGQKENFGYNTAGQLTTVWQTVGGVTAQFTISYGSAGYTVTLTNGGQTVSSAEYAFYTGTTGQGNSGDLQRVIKKQWQSGSLQKVGESYYTYYKWGDWDQGSYPGLMKFRLESEAIARLGKDPATATDAELAQYADQHLRYDEFGRVITEVVGGDGATGYSYSLEYYERTGAGRGFNVWASRTTETQPDGSKKLAYCNYTGQVMLMVYKNAAGTEKWHEGYRYGDNGGLTMSARSSAIASYSEGNDGLFTLHSTQGLIYRYTSEPQTGALTKITRTWVSEGDRPESQWTKLKERQYAVRSPSGETFGREMVVSEIIFQSATGDLAPAGTVYAYDWHSGTYALSRKTTTLPTIPTQQNGSGASVQRAEIYNLQGQVVWSQDERGFLTCHRYSAYTGARTQTIEDVDTSVAGLPGDKPSGWTTPSGGGLHLISDFESDDQGRRTQTLGPVHQIDLNGVATNVRRATWKVNVEAEHSTYEGAGYAIWNSGTSSYDYTLIDPVKVTRRNEDGKVTDQVVAKRNPTISGRLTADDPFTDQSRWFRWSSTGYDVAGKLSWTRLYVSIPGSGAGTSGTNYHQTDYGYDAVGRLNRTRTPGGTITRRVFNVRGWELSSWTGTDDTGATDSNPAGSGGANNMVKVTEKIYDGGVTGGDGNLTELKQYASATVARSTGYGYDFRDRRTSVDGEIDLYVAYSYDNANRLTQIDRHHTTAAGTLLGRQARKYDNLGRYYEWSAYAVSSNGTVGNALKQALWFDPSGQLLKQREFNAKAYSKNVYDGVGRLTRSYVACGVTDGSYAQAASVADDYVLQQTEYQYDAAGNVIFQRVRERNHNATGTGALQGPSGTQPNARVSYTAAYADALGRGVAAANYGTGGGTEPARPATIPASSGTCLVNRSHYNDRGENDTNTDPQGTVTRQEYDAAGQLLKTIENYRTSGSGTDINKTIDYTYNPDGSLTHLKAQNGTTGEQVTEWLYGTTLSDSGVASSQLVRAKKYPDSTSSSDRVEFKFDRLGQVTEIKDQAGTVHVGDYDALGRLLHDRVTTLGSGIDTTVQRLSITYNARGMLDHLSSHSSPTVGSGSVVNDVQFGYDGFNQLITEHQSHSGATTGTTPKVQYGYASGSSLTARRTQSTYPDGRVIALQYGSTGSLDDLANRIASYEEWNTPLVAYTRRGINSTVKVQYPEPAVALTYIKLAGEPVGDGGDQYTGLDRFNRIVDIRWLAEANNANVDRYQYGFDQASNRRWRQNTTGSGWDEYYTYDGLYQLRACL